jgi:hypothetical protein
VLQEERHLLLIGSLLAAEAGRPWPRLASQGVYLQAGVIGQGVKAAHLSGLQRLQCSIFFVRIASLLGRQAQAQLAWRYQLPAAVGQKLAVLGDLAGVIGGEEKLGHQLV